MKVNRSEVVAAVFAGLLCVAVPSYGDNSSKKPTPPPSQAPANSPAAGSPAAKAPKHQPGPLDDFVGLDYTEEQRAQIRKVHEDTLSRLDKIAKDPKLDAETKAAMLQGYVRIEYGEVYKVLNPEQQAEVRKKVAARHAEEQKQRSKSARGPKPPAPPRQ